MTVFPFSLEKHISPKCKGPNEKRYYDKLNLQNIITILGEIFVVLPTSNGRFDPEKLVIVESKLADQ
jgi:hypothetical protein